MKTFAPYAINSADEGPGYVSYAVVQDGATLERGERYLAYGHNLIASISWAIIVEWKNMCPDFDASCFYEEVIYSTLK